MISLHLFLPLPVHSQGSNHNDTLADKLYYATLLLNTLHCLPLLSRIKAKFQALTSKSCVSWHPLALWPSQNTLSRVHFSYTRHFICPQKTFILAVPSVDILKAQVSPPKALCSNITESEKMPLSISHKAEECSLFFFTVHCFIIFYCIYHLLHYRNIQTHFFLFSITNSPKVLAQMCTNFVYYTL